ncbi:hypothetical protein J7E63_15465 [Bacillus sp. ISL-75]|uniref:hypothetical protein n=1 Tax=Bacillus sp. ISL-75 TaxID=2819137 RepID=UPI001BEC9571|nr:hypothetical protein [Bacillus sp. ISL-75]MBT2728330.1 hypothetical protein [Bacillus sp. ISL-75]
MIKLLKDWELIMYIFIKSIVGIPRIDYVANKDAKRYAVAVDPSGKLGWTKNYISDESSDRTGDHIVEVLTE